MIRGCSHHLALSLCFSLSLLAFRAGAAGTVDTSAAQAAFQGKNYPKVVEILGPHVEDLNRIQLFMLAKAYSETKNSNLAIKTYQAELAQNPKDAEAKYHIGLEYLGMNKEREGMTALRDALDINPKYEPAYLEIAKIYERRKNKYELRLLFEDLIAKVGRKPAYIAKLCELTTMDGQYDLSKQYCNEGIQLDPSEAKNRVYLAITKKETGLPEEAATLFMKAADSNSHSDFAQIAAAEFFASQKNFLKAYNYSKRATVANPQSTKAWMGLGTSSMELQKYDEAYSAFVKGCAIDRTPLVEARRANAVLKQLKTYVELQHKFELLIETCGNKS